MRYEAITDFVVVGGLRLHDDGTHDNSRGLPAMRRLLHGDRIRFTSGDSKGMNKLAAFAIGIILVAGVISTAKADTIIFDDGSMYDLQPGESVYVSKGRVWEFTRFQPLDLRIQALEPFTMDQADDSCLGFGPGGCVPSSDGLSESDFADLIEKLTQNIANTDG